MSVPAGTYTFGVGGTYPTLNAVWNFLVANNPLAGDVTILMVGNSDDTGVFIQPSTAVSLLDHTLTIKGNTPHYGSPLNGHVAKYGNCIIKTSGGGKVIFDDFYGYALVSQTTLTQAGALISGANIRPVEVIVKNSLFKATNGQALGVSSPAMTSKTSGGGSGALIRWNLSVYNSKFWGSTGAFQFIMGGGGDTLDRISVYVENCAAMTYASGGVFSQRAAYTFLVTGPSTFSGPMLNFGFRNNVAWVNDASSQMGVRFENITDDSYYRAFMTNNARNQGLDSSAYYTYNGISSPADVISINEAAASFLDDSNTSALFTNGTTPLIAGNPYTAPYPIGIWYSAFTPTTITVQPQDVTANTYNQAQIGVTATGSNLTYQWQFSSDCSTFSNISNDANYSGVTTSQVTITASPSVQGCYRVIVTGDGGSVTSNNAYLTVLGPVPSTGAGTGKNRGERHTATKEAHAPSINKQASDASPGFVHNSIADQSPSQNYQHYKRGFKDGYIAIVPEKGGYLAGTLGTGHKVQFYKENLAIHGQPIELNPVGNSRASRERVMAPTKSGGAVTFAIRSNDSIPILMSHFQKRNGTLLNGATTYYEFCPPKNTPTLLGSTFGTGTYSDVVSVGGINAYTVSVYKAVNGTGYHLKSGLCDSLEWQFNSSGEAELTAFMKFGTASIVGTSAMPFLGSYSTLPAFSGYNCDINFAGLPLTAFAFKGNNNLFETELVGTSPRCYYGFGRYQVTGRASVDVPKNALAYIGSMLSGVSFNVYGTLTNSAMDKIVFQMPNCQLDTFDFNINSSTGEIPFKAYESEDGTVPPLKILVWTHNYSATSFEPN